MPTCDAHSIWVLPVQMCQMDQGLLLETRGLLTGEADGDVTREGPHLKAVVLLRIANITSPPSYSPPFHTASQTLRSTLDTKGAVSLLCRKGDRQLSTLYILLDHRHLTSCFSGLHLYMMSEGGSERARGCVALTGARAPGAATLL